MNNYKISDVLENLVQEIKELENKIDNLISYTNSLYDKFAKENLL